MGERSFLVACIGSVMAAAPGIKSAIDLCGIDRVMYGTDYPFWDPANYRTLLSVTELSDGDNQKLFVDNARRISNIPAAAATKPAAAQKEPALSAR